jgi:hypothetical protein
MRPIVIDLLEGRLKLGDKVVIDTRDLWKLSDTDRPVITPANGSGVDVVSIIEDAGGWVMHVDYLSQYRGWTSYELFLSTEQLETLGLRKLKHRLWQLTIEDYE